MRVRDRSELLAWLSERDLGAAVARLAGRPLVLMHAEGDAQIAAAFSEELYERAGEPRRLLVVPGGDHRTLQHDPELQAEALREVERRLAPG